MLYYPRLNNIPKSKEMLTYFGGYDHRITCQEGFFFDEKNISTDDFPVISARKPRFYASTFPYEGKILGALSTPDADMYVVKPGNSSTYSELTIEGDTPYHIPSHQLNLEDKTILKMGKYIAVFPDKKWFKPGTGEDSGECGDIEASKAIASGTTVKFQLVDSDGSNITINTAAEDGNYRIVNVNGKSALQVYSSATNMWVNVATVYFKIESTGIGTDFKKGDGVKITCDFSSATVKNYKNIWVNDEGNGKRSSNFVIKERGDNYITVVGILGEASKTVTNIPVTVERKCPDIAYVCECQNRLWGCSKDGHEIYACKLGDVTNWNCFDGVSTDSWAATVGSDGEFTGAFAYLGYPIFFKEDKILKVSISGYGAHSYKEMESRGVQNGSSRSLVMINELLYYKSKTNVCMYDGNFPQEIGDELNDKYINAVGCGYKDKYYLSLEHNSKPESLFVYDTKNQIWAREDNIRVNYFMTHKGLTAWTSTGIAAKPINRITLIDDHSDYADVSEGKVDWMLESGNIGFAIDEKKYIAKMSFRLKLEVGAYVQLFIEYDSSGNWEHVWNVTGKGTRTFTIPVRPKRCDHYRFKLVGKGDCKIFSFSKTYEEGSDM